MSAAANTSSPVPTMAQLAQSVVDTMPPVSKSFQLDSTKKIQVVETFNRSLSQEMRAARLGNFTLTVQFIGIAKGKTCIVTCPTLASDAGNRKTFIASLGNSWEKIMPIQVDDPHHYVVTLSRKESAETLKLPTMQDDPSQLKASHSDGDGNEIPPSMERIHFDGVTSPGDTPCIVALPLVYPVTLGEEVIIGHDIKDNLPPDAPLSSEFRTWYAGMQYLHAHNSAKSLHAQDDIFKLEDIQPAAFGNLPLTEGIEIKYHMLDTLETQHSSVRVILQEHRSAALLRCVASNPAPMSPTQVTSPGTGTLPCGTDIIKETVQRTLEGTFDAMKTPQATLTGTEREQLSVSETVLDQQGSAPRSAPSPSLEMPGLVQRITINLEEFDEARTLHYVPSKNVDEAPTIRIDGVDCNAPMIHPFTLRGGGKTPRHLCTAEMVQQLQPVLINPTCNVDMVDVDLGNGTTNTIFYCKADSSHPALRNVYNAYKERRGVLETSYMAIEKEFHHVDLLGGGSYVPLGLGCFYPGPAGVPKHFEPVKGEGKYPNPFLLRSAKSIPARDLQDNIGPLQGAVAELLETLCPNVFAANTKLLENAQDCIYPPQACQVIGRSDHRGKPLHVNQVAARIIGMDAGGESAEYMVVALHVDESDEDAVLPLQFYPLGGDDGSGGPVANSDLLVFQHVQGGKCYRVNTSVQDTVVIVAMNSAKQLHGGVFDGQQTVCNSNNNNPAWSLRLVPFCQKKIIQFVKARHRYGRGQCERAPTPFVNLHGMEQVHRPLTGDELFDGRRTAVPWGPKDKLYRATLRKKSGSGKLDLEWDGARKLVSYDWKGDIYDEACFSNRRPRQGNVCNCLRKSSAS